MVWSTELLPSPITCVYRTPYMVSDSRNPVAIMSASVKVDNPLQFLKHLWFGGSDFFFCAIEHTAQYFIFDTHV